MKILLTFLRPEEDWNITVKTSAGYSSISQAAAIEMCILLRWACTMCTAVTTPVGRWSSLLRASYGTLKRVRETPPSLLPPCLSSRHGCSILHACAVSLNYPLHVVCRSAAELPGSQECSDSTALAVNRRVAGH